MVDNKTYRTSARADAFIGGIENPFRTALVRGHSCMFPAGIHKATQ